MFLAKDANKRNSKLFILNSLLNWDENYNSSFIKTVTFSMNEKLIKFEALIDIEVQGSIFMDRLTI